METFRHSLLGYWERMETAGHIVYTGKGTEVKVYWAFSLIRTMGVAEPPRFIVLTWAMDVVEAPWESSVH